MKINVQNSKLIKMFIKMSPQLTKIQKNKCICATLTTKIMMPSNKPTYKNVAQLTNHLLYMATIYCFSLVIKYIFSVSSRALLPGSFVLHTSPEINISIKNHYVMSVEN